MTAFAGFTCGFVWQQTACRHFRTFASSPHWSRREALALSPRHTNRKVRLRIEILHQIAAAVHWLFAPSQRSGTVEGGSGGGGRRRPSRPKAGSRSPICARIGHAMLKPRWSPGPGTASKMPRCTMANELRTEQVSQSGVRRSTGLRDRAATLLCRQPGVQPAGHRPGLGIAPQCASGGTNMPCCSSHHARSNP